jgi:pimeloyl-ACP methyl ester carboxylesterase
LLSEAQLRRSAGQHRLVETLLENFPVDDVRGPTLERVRELSGQYRQERDRIAAIAGKLRETIAAITEPDERGTATPAAEEIIRELTHNNVDRLAPFVQLLNDDSLSPDEKASLAISGWLLGQNDADQNLPISVSLLRVRDLVWRYLREPLAAERAKLLAAIQSEESASVERVAKLVAHMKPPWHDPQQVADEDGYLELAAPGQADEGDVRYVVQLPPEYDPYRRYPTLVVLCGGYNSPEQELNFWAGTPPEPAAPGAPTTRRGHAMRHGYITIAIEWQKPHQYEYEYTGREHIAVLSVLRDATRRFNIDADRVFLSGHDIGGEAAWDLGLAHPDLWAGVIPFVALADKYIYHYSDNGRYVPMYFVAGELDGASISENAAVWDIYLSKPPRDGLPGYDATVVEYQGRGHEPFHDEILNLFDWMARRTRAGIPKSFQCTTLRPWDNFFWWVECGPFPDQFMIHPTEWTGRRPRPVKVEGKIQAKNRLWARSPAEVTTLWLSPELVDFSAPIRITFNGSKLAQPEGGVRPDIEVLLEDVRTRADRQRPFWAKLETR